MLPGGVEERPELGGCPYSPRFGAGLARSFCPFDRIGQKDLVNDHGVTERFAQYRMDILDGARGQTRAVPATVCGQLAVELRDTSRAHGLEPQLGSRPTASGAASPESRCYRLLTCAAERSAGGAGRSVAVRLQTSPLTSGRTR